MAVCKLFASNFVCSHLKTNATKTVRRGFARFHWFPIIKSCRNNETNQSLLATKKSQPYKEIIVVFRVFKATNQPKLLS